MLVDSHAHLDFDSFDNDRPEVIQRALDSGVELLLNICLGPEAEKYEKSLAISSLHPNFYSAVGVHPHDASRMPPECLDQLRAYIQRDKKIVAVGEIGLDYYYEHSDRRSQIKVFDLLLDFALETNLPVSIHTRNAFSDTFGLLQAKDVFRRVGGIIHCFTGTQEEARKFVSLGAYVSFSGIVTFKKSTELALAAQEVPLDRLLIETDAPYLAPEPHRGKRNEPAFVRHVAEKIAALKGTTADHIGSICSTNLKTLLKLPSS